MELDKQIKLGHLLLVDRKCRVCDEVKNLIDGFYQTRKNKGHVSSSYSYECKECTTKRVINSRKNNKFKYKWQYPDW